ncbi:MAG: hypothetical protein HW387_691 [Parachlamydiales bacterium]|nr:hypothetical protein [Parachlamydiales bacterium]
MSSRIYPKSGEALDTFRKMIYAPNDEQPIVEMNDVTARDMNVIWDSISAIAARWRGKQEMHFPDMPMDRKEFWGFFAADHQPTPLPVVNEFVDGWRTEGGLAIDLGGGNSPTANPLLQKGWRVIVIDNSRPALDILRQNNLATVESGQLQIIEADVETFSPSEPADLVVAADILPYIDPAQFRTTWNKIHDKFIKENGFLVGNLFRTPTHPELIPQMNSMKEMGAWFLPDRRMVRPLLTQTGYVIKTCKYRIDEPSMEPICIQFIAEKKSAEKQMS